MISVFIPSSSLTIIIVITVGSHGYKPKNACTFHNSFTWFIFNLSRIKICTVLYTIIQSTVINVLAFKHKKPLLGMVAFSARMQTSHAFQSHAASQLPHFPQAVGLSLHTHTCDTISKLAEKDMGTLEFFLVR
jgi:hypothetical protein